MAEPLVSVIIPTCSRPQYVAHAVESALACSGDDVEVIVVPNGPDQSWHQSLAGYVRDPRVTISAIKEANGNAARNHGMSMARGKYIRFLDDDDHLLPAAGSQVSQLEELRLDMSVGRIDVIAASGKLIGVRKPTDAVDFVNSFIGANHVSLPHAYLYRRASISGFTWDPGVRLGQDKHWLYQLCEAQDWQVASTSDAVGVWLQHDGPRVSGQERKRIKSRTCAAMLWDTLEILDTQNRLSAHRRTIAAKHLWQLICGAYYLETSYWEPMVDKVLTLDAASRPDLVLCRHRPTCWLPPRWILHSTVPLQHFRRVLRLAGAKLSVYHPVTKP